MNTYVVQKGGMNWAQAYAASIKNPGADVIEFKIKEINRPITISNTDHLTLKGNGVKIDAKGAAYDMLVNHSSYITVDDFEFTGAKTGFTGRFSHHIALTNAESHDNLGHGAYFFQSNYVAVRYGEFYRNGTDGLSMHMAANIGTGKTMYQNWIQNNVFHNNTTKVNTTEKWGWLIDEFDVWRPRHIALGYEDYLGKTLVSGNVSYGNGRSGGHVFHSDNVRVVNNTFYDNNVDNPSNVFDAELRITESDNARVFNNIMIADGDRDDDFAFSAVNSDNLVARGNHSYIENYPERIGVRLLNLTHSSVLPELNHWADQSLHNLAVDTNQLDWG